MSDSNDTVYSKDLKKSQFVQKSSGDLLDSDTYDFVSNGQNFKVPLSELIKKFGTTGSLVTKGEVTGVPVLNINGTENQIRNIVGGAGIVPSLSPEDGVLLDQGFSTGDAGSPILIKETEDSPVIRNLVPGDGIGIAASGDNLVISQSGSATPSNVVVVNSMSDFPTAVSGVITLGDDSAYLVSADLSTGNRFVLGNNTLVYAADALVASLEYTGSGTMFTCTALSSKLKDITLDCPNGKLLDISSSGSGTFQMIGVIVPECDELGTIANMKAMQMVSCRFQSIITDGFSFSGTMGIFAAARNLFTISAGCVFDFGTASFTAGWSLETSFAVLAAGTCFIDGLADSGNMAVGALGTLFNTRFEGTGDILNNIAITDSRWQFFGNDDIGDTRADGLLSLKGNTTETVISVATTPVLIAGTWTVEEVSQFTGTTAGRLTYGGSKIAKLPVTLSLTGEPASGVNKTITYHLFKNGVKVTNADQPNIISSGGSKNTTLVWQLDLDTDDYLEAYVSNDTDTINVLVSHASFRIN
jgi:hypothetical protein